jgi:pyrimidine operon attenuation protein/uracil phosphoribosyltransferase
MGSLILPGVETEGMFFFQTVRSNFTKIQKGADESGVFNIASKDDDDDDADIEQTADPEQALPEDWQVILIDD